jgi:hypothetical protein
VSDFLKRGAGGKLSLETQEDCVRELGRIVEGDPTILPFDNSCESLKGSGLQFEKLGCSEWLEQLNKPYVLRLRVKSDRGL